MFVRFFVFNHVVCRQVSGKMGTTIGVDWQLSLNDFVKFRYKLGQNEDHWALKAAIIIIYYYN